MKISPDRGAPPVPAAPPGSEQEVKTMEIPLLYSLNTEARTPT